MKNCYQFIYLFFIFAHNLFPATFSSLFIYHFTVYLLSVLVVLSVPGADMRLSLALQRELNPALPELGSLQQGLSSSLTNSFSARSACSCLMEMLHCSLILCPGPLFPEHSSEWAVILSSFWKRGSGRRHKRTHTGLDGLHPKYLYSFFYPMCAILHCRAKSISSDYCSLFFVEFLF